MATTVNKLIENAYKTANLFAEDRIIDGAKIIEGLNVLNEILDNFAGAPDLIAYDEILSFPITSSQREYTISREAGADVDANRLVHLKYCIVKVSSIQYVVNVTTDYEYWRRNISLLIHTRPREVYLQNERGLSKIIFIHLPDRNYTCEIKGKFVLDNLTLNTDITNVPQYYLYYLRFKLAEYLALEYMSSNWTPKHEQMLQKLEKRILSAADIDTNLRINKDYYYYYNDIGVVP
jgi:hypothetical protein